MAKLQVTHPHAVSANILALRIETGDITRGTQKRYQKQPGDVVQTKPAKHPFTNPRQIVSRDGKVIGALVEDGKVIRTLDTITGPELDEAWVKQAANYTINGIKPKSVFIKSKPSASARVGLFEDNRKEFSKYDFAMEHTVYLEMPEPMKTGQSYKVDFKGEELEDLTFDFSPEKVRSEAVHVSHIGFQPKDPAKVAFLSTWMGPQGKGLSYKPGQKFWLVDNKGRKVYEGEIELSKGRNQPEDNVKGGTNYSGTDVYMADFSDFQNKGQFKVVVDEVGASFPFTIGDRNWSDAFQVSMEGLFTQRSGIAKTKQFSEYTAPRSFHPDDGVKVYQSGAQVINTRTGLAQGVSMFPQLDSQLTNEIVPDAWGGHMDAGDWDRSTQHLEVYRSLLELGELFPDYFKQTNLTIPESNNKVADVIDEALWGVDFFKRLQTKEGGVRGGIESASHPQDMEASWQESLKVIAYSPDIWTSYRYAGVAARAAHVLKDIDPARAKGYSDSAVKAMNWAEAENNRNPGKYKKLSKYWKIPSERNLAAAELYRATGGEEWHDMFLSSTVFTKPGEKAFRSTTINGKKVQYDHKDAAFVYARTERPVDKTVQGIARAAVLASGEVELAAINQAGFKWSKNPSVKVGWGAHDGFARRQDVLRSHHLTGDEKFLKGAVLGSQFIAGANPENTSYTTGIGPRQPDSVHHVDSYVRGQKAPKGISIYGPADLSTLPRGSKFALDDYREKASTQPEDWPVNEGLIDVFKFIPGSEYTITETIGPNAYALGYLAANSSTGGSGRPPVPTPVDPKPPETPAPDIPTPEIPTPETPAPSPTPTPGPGEPSQPMPRFLKYEAESLTLNNLRRKRSQPGVASGEKYVDLSNSNGATKGTAQGTFQGPEGEYSVSVGYFDEADGKSIAQITVAGQRRSFTFNQDLGDDNPSEATKAEKTTHDSIKLKPGDRFELKSRVNGGENGALDYIVFDPIKTASVTAPTALSVSKPMMAPKAQGIENLVIDLSNLDFDNDGKVDETVKATFRTASEAAYNNTVGFYPIEDMSGAIKDPLIGGKLLMPGDEGYRQAAIAQRIEGLDLNASTDTLTTQLKGGQILAPFIVANNTPEEALKTNKRVDLGTAYFAFEAANADGASHVRSQGGSKGAANSTLGFEDLWGGGDKNFTELTVSTELAA